MGTIRQYMKPLVLALALMAAPLWATSQVAVVPMGGHVSGSAGELTVSLGQCATQTVYDTALTVSIRTASLTEGVLQSYLLIELSIDDAEPLACNIRLFPNPTTESLTLEVDDLAPTLHYSLFSLNGQQLLEGRFSQRAVLDVSNLLSGNYMQRIEDTERNQSNVYKVVKIR